MKTTAILTATLGLVLGSLHAQTVPTFLNYQGRVTDSAGVGLGTGTPVNRKIVFRIYDAANAGNKMWTEEQTVTISNGEFSVLLGLGINATGTAAGEVRPAIASVFTSLSGSGPSGANRFIGVTVDNGDNTISAADVEIAPRQQITSTAYAFRADVANKITAGADSTFTGTTIAGGTFSGSTISAPIITGGNFSGGGTLAGTFTGGTLSGTTLSNPTIAGGTLSGTFTGGTFTGGTFTGGTFSGSTFTGGNFTGGNLSMTGTVTAAGTVTGGNLSTAGTVTATSFSGSGTASFAGNVGIGTAASGALLQLNSATRFSERLRFSGQEWTAAGNTSTDGPTFLLGANRSANYRQLWLADSAALAVNNTNTVLRFNISGTSTPWIDTVSTDGTTVKNLGLMINGGNLGIGTNTPTQAKLVVNGSTSGNYSSVYLNKTAFTYWEEIGGNGDAYVPLVKEWAGGVAHNVSIYASNDVAGAGFIAFSDARIKRVEGRSDAARDLANLMSIEVTDYTYIDILGKGTGTNKKVIAQQVEKVFPQAVSKSTDVVPDIYRKAEVKEGWVHLVTNLKKGERVRLIGEKKEGIHEVLEVAEGRFRTDFVSEGDHVFVFGREVNDFRSVDYEAIAMLNVSATQQIKREKDAEVKSLREENSELRTRVAALEAKDKARDAKMASIEKLLRPADQETRAADSLKTVSAKP